MKKMWKKVLVYMMSVAMLLGTVNVPVHAQNSLMEASATSGETAIESAVTDEVNNGKWDHVTVEDIYEGENYKVRFTLQSFWDSGYNAVISVENTGVNVIHNWCLEFNYWDSINNIWNAEVIENTDSGLRIKNVGWNQDIAVGGSVEFGISSDHAFNGFPDSYRLRGIKHVIDANDYMIEYQRNESGEDDVIGSIVVSNVSDHVLEDWVLEFELEEEILDIWNGEIKAHNGNHYVINNCGYNGEISKDSYLTIGIRTSCRTENGAPTNFEFYSYGVYEESGEEESGDEEQDEEKSDEDIDDFKKDRLIDTDGDGLSDFIEKQQGTNVSETDTDGDGLSDYWELISIVLEPTLSDTDENGTNDGEEDTDGDGLTNLEEIALGSSITRSDTDGDGLSDGDEIRLYLTDPLFRDTDADGLPDGEEIKLHLNPTNVDTDGDGIADGNELLPQRTETVIQNEEKAAITGVAVNLDCVGDIEKCVVITDVYGVDTYSSNVVGLIGVPVEIQCDSPFDNATISFGYDEAELGDTLEEDLCILWYDEAHNRYELLADSVVDTENHTVSYRTEHFSTYMVVDQKKWEDVWETKSIREWEKIEKRVSYDIAICLDYSVSEEELAKEKLFAKSIIMQMMPGDRVRIGVYLPSTLNTYCSGTWIKDESIALSKLDNLERDIYYQFYAELKPTGSYYSQSYQAISLMKDMTDKVSSNKKVGFLVNAGKNEDVQCAIVITTKQEAEACLIEMGYPVRSVSVTERENKELSELLRKYRGNSYNSSSLGGIERRYGFDLPGIEDVDTDGDGFLDVYEINGIRTSNGQIIYTLIRETHYLNL